MNHRAQNSKQERMQPDSEKNLKCTTAECKQVRGQNIQTLTLRAHVLLTLVPTQKCYVETVFDLEGYIESRLMCIF